MCFEFYIGGFHIVFNHVVIVGSISCVECSFIGYPLAVVVIVILIVCLRIEKLESISGFVEFKDEIFSAPLKLLNFFFLTLVVLDIILEVSKLSLGEGFGHFVLEISNEVINVFDVISVLLKSGFGIIEVS